MGMNGGIICVGSSENVTNRRGGGGERGIKQKQMKHKKANQQSMGKGRPRRRTNKMKKLDRKNRESRVEKLCFRRNNVGGLKKRDHRGGGDRGKKITCRSIRRRKRFK